MTGTPPLATAVASHARWNDAGNGVVECTEACDDGNVTPGDGCSPMCAIESDFCGNGVVEMGEDCDLGALNVDRPGIEVSQGSTIFIGGPIQRTTPANFFYAFVSASAHTGFEQSELSNVFLYRDLSTGVMSLFLVHGIDFDTSGVFQPDANVQMALSGFPPGTSVLIADDNATEFFAVGPTDYFGGWQFRSNTDGGVITDLEFPGDWTVVIRGSFTGALRQWRWVNDNNQFQTLDLAQPLTIRAYGSASVCRTNCTIPRCGDGILDGGEACDDGNTVDGDFCRADCSGVVR